MATWASVFTFNTTINPSIHLYGNKVSSDGVRYIYFCDKDPSTSDIWVWRYDTTTDTATQISDGSSFAANYELLHFSFPIWFNSGVYVMPEDQSSFTTNILIYKWDGAGTSWTQMESFALQMGGAGNQWNEQVLEVADSSGHLILMASEFNTASTNGQHNIRYSANGSAWSTGSVSISDTPGNSSMTPSFGITQRAESNTYCAILQWLLGGSFFHYVACSWDGNTFNEIDYRTNIPSSAGSIWVSRWKDTDLMWWSTDHSDYGSKENYDIVTVISGSWNEPNIDITDIVHTDGFVTTSLKGLSRTSGTLYYMYSTGLGTWTDSETVQNGGDSYNGRSAIRLSSGDVWLIAYGPGSPSAPVEIFKRSEVFGGLSYDLTHSAGGIPGSVFV